MKRIFDNNQIESLAKTHGIPELFNTNIIPHLELLYFEPGEYICRENDPLDYFYFVLGGKVKVYVTLGNGKSLLLCFYEGLKVLGDSELMNGNPASTNVQTIDSSYCLGIPSSKIESLLLNDQKFLRYACSALGEKLVRLSQNSSINLLYPLENRLSSYIIAVSEKTLVFNENLTEISELLGTSYRHLLRTFKLLIEKEILRKDGHAYIIYDLQALKKLAADVYV